MGKLMDISNLNGFFSSLWEGEHDRIILKYMEDRQVCALTAGSFLKRAEEIAACLVGRNL